MTEQVEQKHFPIEYSLRGDNTHYIACEHRRCRQNYAICLNILKANNEGRRKPEGYCTTEIAKGVCDAAKMREEELAAGHTLYYVPRKKVEVKPVESKPYVVPVSVKQSSGYKRGFGHADDVLNNKAPAAPAPRPAIAPKQETVKPKIEAMDIAAVVTQMAKDHAAGVTEPKKPEVQPQPKASESMLEKARRIREQRGQL